MQVQSLLYSDNRPICVSPSLVKLILAGMVGASFGDKSTLSVLTVGSAFSNDMFVEAVSRTLHTMYSILEEQYAMFFRY